MVVCYKMISSEKEEEEEEEEETEEEEEGEEEVRCCMSHSETPATLLNLFSTEWILILIDPTSSSSFSLPFLRLADSWDESTSQISLMNLCLQTRENLTHAGKPRE